MDLAELQSEYDITQLAKSSKYYHIRDLFCFFDFCFFGFFSATILFLFAGETVRSFTYKVQNISK